jgi:hypothetical protein
MKDGLSPLVVGNPGFGNVILSRMQTERGRTMKGGIFITGSGPILILTSYESLSEPKLVQKLATKGIKKYIAFEVPVDTLKHKYGQHYSVILGDLHQQDDLRVLDYDGHHVFGNFSFQELGSPVFQEG